MALASTQCYWPNGQEVTAYNYQPCNAGSDPQHAGCCDLRTSVCTEYGYCIGNTNYYYRGGCTDKTWMSSSCAQACSFADEAYLGDFANFYDCGNGTWTENKNWCCGQAGKSCCDHTFSIALGRPYFPTSAAVASSTGTTTTATSSTLGSVAATTSIPSNRDSQKSTDTKTVGVGVGVAVGVGALILAAVGYFFCRERKRRVRLEQKYQAILASAPVRDGQYVNVAHQPPTEKDAATSSSVHEVPIQQRYEVQG